jgi:hypothetical protein
MMLVQWINGRSLSENYKINLVLFQGTKQKGDDTSFFHFFGDATCIQHDHRKLSYEICSKLNCHNLKDKAWMLHIR